MHGFVRKGLLLSAATGTLVMGYAGSAAAAQGAEGDSAVTQGAAADSPGAVSGNVAQVPADVPIQVCGDAAGAGAAMVGSRDNNCGTNDTTAEAEGVAADSPGAISGNVGSVAAKVPIQACGLGGGAVAADVTAQRNDCVDDGTHALAQGFAADSPGLASGNVLQLPADVPVQACGDAVALLAYDVSADDNRCVNAAPATSGLAQPPLPAPPSVENYPPPPSVPCPLEEGAAMPTAGLPALGLPALPAMPAMPAMPAALVG